MAKVPLGESDPVGAEAFAKFADSTDRLRKIYGDDADERLREIFEIQWESYQTRQRQVWINSQTVFQREEAQAETKKDSEEANDRLARRLRKNEDKRAEMLLRSQVRQNYLTLALSAGSAVLGTVIALVLRSASTDVPVLTAAGAAAAAGLGGSAILATKAVNTLRSLSNKSVPKEISKKQVSATDRL